MKKILVIATLGLFVLGMSSCGGRHLCPAYGGQADMTKKEVKSVDKIELIQEKAQAQ
jgi:hypothetical protein